MRCAQPKTGPAFKVKIVERYIKYRKSSNKKIIKSTENTKCVTIRTTDSFIKQYSHQLVYLCTKVTGSITKVNDHLATIWGSKDFMSQLMKTKHSKLRILHTFRLSPFLVVLL